MRAIIYPILFLFVLAAIPWFFPSGSEARLFGFPAWAVYSVGVAILFAAVVSFFITRFWDDGEGEDKNSPGP